MAGKSPLKASAEQKLGLETLAASRDRGEADRARAVLLTLAGWTSRRIAEAFAVREDTVRLWRSDFMRGGFEALKASIAPGPVPVKTEAALRVITPLLEAPSLTGLTGRSRVSSLRSRDVRALRLADRSCPKRCEKKFRWRRPRHTLKGRQIAAEIDRVGLRLQLRRAQARAGDIVLLYADESEALTHPYLARAWAKRGADLRVPAPGQAKKVAMMGALDWLQRKLIVATSRTKRSTDFIALLVTLDHLYGPKPGVIVLDNGLIHVSKATSAALAARAHWLTVEWLPKYAPELNDIEVVWHDLKAFNLAHKTFTDVDTLDAAIHSAVADLNTERNRDLLGKQRISA